MAHRKHNIGGGGNAHLRREIANLERNLQEATDQYVRCSTDLYEVYCAGMGIDPVNDDFVAPDSDGPAATVRRRGVRIVDDRDAIEWRGTVWVSDSAYQSALKAKVLL